MQVRVLYYGVLRQKYISESKEVIPLQAGATVADLVTEICTRHPDFTAVRNRIRIAVNEDFASDIDTLADHDTVALIPPVAGGAEPYCRLSDQPLSVDEVLAAVCGPGQGGLVVFVGNVRDHNAGHDVTHLEYEAYPEMVLRTFRSIVARCEATGEGVRVAIAHRTGDLQIGEAAVILAASAPHRAEAFAAARQAIEELKTDAPIWKKEHSRDGAEWVGMGP
jgi:molybdopterin converting factor subunit 1